MARIVAGMTTSLDGPDLIRQMLRAGFVDELWVDTMPLLRGAVRRLFDDPDLSRVRPRKLAVREVAERTSPGF